MPFLCAQIAIGCVICGSVIDTRTIYGDLVVMVEGAAFMTTIAFLASVATGATASAFGVRRKPTRKSTLSRVTSSCARRLATSGAGPVVSFCTISIFLPATVSPFAFMYAFMPPRICCPYCANGPENSPTMPSLIAPWARAEAAPNDNTIAEASCNARTLFTRAPRWNDSRTSYQASSGIRAESDPACAAGRHVGDDGPTAQRQSNITFCQRRLQRSRVHNLIQLGDLQAPVHRIAVVEAMQHRRHPPRKMLGCPDTLERPRRISLKRFARARRV